jgi:uncharacterized membrane protein YbhN (UPF0104 family)
MEEPVLSESVSFSQTFFKKFYFLKKHKKLTFGILKIIIFLTFLYFILTQIDFSRLINSFKSVNLYLIAATSLLMLVNILLQYKKWKIICEAFGFNETRQTILFSLLYGFTAGIFTPARVGEYLGRKLMLRNKSIVKITSATLLDKLFPLFTLLVLGFPIFIYFLKYMNYINLFVFYISIFSFLILVLVAIIFLSKRKFDNSSFLNKVINLFTRGKYSIEMLEGINKNVILKIIFISILFFICYIVQFALLFSAFSINISFVLCFIIACLVMFSKSFIPQISIGDLGIREGAAVFFFTKIGGTAEAALNASLFLFILNLFLPSLMGFIISYKKVNE